MNSCGIPETLTLVFDIGEDDGRGRGEGGGDEDKMEDS